MVLIILIAMLFVGFILYDTWKIANHVPHDQYVLAAIELYLDVVNLFQFLLMLLAGSSRG